MSAGNAPEGDENVPYDFLTRLVRAAARGDEQAWKQLIDRFASLVWSICRAYRLTDEDAADVMQLTWLHLLEHLDQIRDPQRLPGWLATTCRRECQALLRRSRPSVNVEHDDMDRLIGGGSPADEPFLTAEAHAALWQAFQLLSKWCQRVLRELIVDADDGPPSYRLAADKLQVPVGSLGPTRKRCLEQLRNLIDTGSI